MSQQLINRNLDLMQLRNDGYTVEIIANHLVVRDVPYVNAEGQVEYNGILVSPLDMAGDCTVKPKTHVALFSGSHPCNADGSKLNAISHTSTTRNIAPDLTVYHSFSSKPKGGYTDYHHKMTTYIAMIMEPARNIDAKATAQLHRPVECTEDSSVFHYLDTASSRAGITEISAKLAIPKVAIIGLGGTGSYILDLIVKAPITEIHLFDGDVFYSHNAFRAPGAASVDELRKQPLKVDYHAQKYGVFRKNIVSHPSYLHENNLCELDEMHSVFIAMDGSKDKRSIIRHLEERGITFIDAGMGIELADGSLGGIVRVTTSCPENRNHIHEKKRISYDDGEDNPYESNIQVADLNALNACMAVIRWKKLLGFYRDLEQEFHSLYTLDGNTIINEDQSEE